MPTPPDPQETQAGFSMVEMLVANLGAILTALGAPKLWEWLRGKQDLTTRVIEGERQDTQEALKRHETREERLRREAREREAGMQATIDALRSEKADLERAARDNLASEYRRYVEHSQGRIEDLKAQIDVLTQTNEALRGGAAPGRGEENGE